MTEKPKDCPLFVVGRWIARAILHDPKVEGSGLNKAKERLRKTEGLYAGYCSPKCAWWLEETESYYGQCAIVRLAIREDN